ncbi:MAG TPA: IS3 family transposase [Prolixibacteraceae bacterium]|nr:IS3 family transposase [Prolixibacteraceae bacterium]
MDTLCGLFGKSRQAYYQRSKHVHGEALKEDILLQMVQSQRRQMPRLGGRKLLHLIQPLLVGEMSLGRDSFFDFLRKHNLLVGKRRLRARTTWSNHWLHKYPNLIVGYEPEKAHRLWVSDITYIPTEEGFCFLSLITDGYSRKIIGWASGNSLEASHSVKALKMALGQLPKGIRDVFHHSDRGVQYCCGEYVKILRKNHFQISMTENSDPRENAMAERVNGILKGEWLNQMSFKTIKQAESEISKIIRIYNQQRPHSSLEMKTPCFVHQSSCQVKRIWKNYYKKKEIDSFAEPNKVMVTL